MSIKRVLQNLNFLPDSEELLRIKEETKIFCRTVEEELKRKKIDADVFVGGSFAKETLVKDDNYDVDIFVRFDWKYENLSEMLEEVLLKACKLRERKLERVHGSRDYFRVRERSGLLFEIIPVTRIKKANEMRNITDLSFFHVNYVLRNLPKKSRGEVTLAKKFFKAQGVYGAESYINGFSGYGLECLIIYYGTFEKMVKSLAKINERKIIDLKNYYKNKNEIFVEMSESKMSGPVVLVDPTKKDRNVLAALNWETFRKFQEAARAFIEKPSTSFFYQPYKSKEELIAGSKKKKEEVVRLAIETARQEGDIAGTKMKKFSKFLAREVSKYFDLGSSEFFYEGGQISEMIISGKAKKEILVIGPPKTNKEAVKKFKENNENTFEKNGIVHSRKKVKFGLADFIEGFKKKYHHKIDEMDIKEIGVRKI